MQYGLNNEIASIVVTAIHIPEDRNAIKFNTPFGAILKDDVVIIASEIVSFDGEMFNEIRSSMVLYIDLVSRIKI